MILAIESTCDESSVALVTSGPRVRAELTASQEPLHERWGGVVPELASRAHQEALYPLVEAVLDRGAATWQDLCAVAVAISPGLMGPLLVGTTLAKGIAISLDLPFLGINHLQGHMSSVCLENREIPGDTIGLLVSGGHTLLLEKTATSWNVLGGTRDDAAGEAFDKGARLLDLPYPGGKLLSDLAAAGDPSRVPFPICELPERQFSFSGLKSELRRRVSAGLRQQERDADIAAGFQQAIIETLLRPVVKLLSARRPSAFVLSGGVSRNELLRSRLLEICAASGTVLMMPEPRWCTDNAAMIGAAALERQQRGEADSLDLQPSARINPRELLARGAL